MITKSAQAHRGACGCPHCKPKQPAAPAPAAREPIPLPATPTPIRLNPAPLLNVDGGGGAPADTSVQDALPLGDTP